jgi:hypothetical protein
MALQLPAVQKLGEQIGINIADGIKGVSEAASGKRDAAADAPGEDTPERGRED